MFEPEAKISKLEFHICLRRFFEPMYPDIDLERISFQDGLPFYVHGTPNAITVGSRIYFDAGTYNPYSRRGIVLIAHELFHVHQGSGGLGFWFARPFYLWYFIRKVTSGWTKGREHPQEQPAYERQDRVAAAYDAAVAASGKSGPCAWTNDGPPQPDQAFIDAFYEAFSG
jgi:hypothetical protein